MKMFMGVLVINGTYGIKPFILCSLKTKWATQSLKSCADIDALAR